MPKLMWAVVLWQSFLGWWWWVGAGVGVREVEELLAKEHKRQQKRKLREQRRKEQRERARSMWKGVTSAFKPTGASPHAQQVNNGGEESDGGGRQTSRASSSTTGSAPTTWRSLYPTQLVRRWYARLRHDHLAAAHLQAVERVERIHQVFGREEARNSMREPRAQAVGWGLGSYGVREAERERREELGAEGEIAGPSGSQVKNADNDDEFTSSGAESDCGHSPDWHRDDEPAQLRRRSTSGHHYVPPQSSSSQASSTSDPPSSSPPAQLQELRDDAGSSMWWWGPLRKWRLQDSTTYR